MTVSEKLLSEMTLLEKVGQLNQRLYGWQIYEKKNGQIRLTDNFYQEVQKFQGLGFVYGLLRADPWSGKNTKTGLNVEEARETTQKIQQFLKKETRLGIPVIFSEECPHGHQAITATTMPVNYTVGNSWNPSLYQKVQQIVAKEMLNVGVHMGLISTIDVGRDPRWGRTEECFSEDPFLISMYTQAALKGFQRKIKNKNLAEFAEAIGLVLKHFTCQGMSIGGHNAGPVNIGIRELWEIYLAPLFKNIREEEIFAVMAAYNDIDGVPCHGNYKLLTELLREKMKFEGFVMADGCALDRLVTLDRDQIQASAWALQSGVDVSLWDQVFPRLTEAVECGQMNIEKLDESVLRVLKTKEKLGLLTERAPFIAYEKTNDDEENIKKLTAESVVLLKNRQEYLPLKQNNQKILVVGPHCLNIYHQLGDYTPYKSRDAGVTIAEGIRRKAQEFGQEVVVCQGSHMTDESDELLQEALCLASEVDVIVVTLGGSSARDFTTTFDDNGAALSGSNDMNCGENMDLMSIELPYVQQKLVKSLALLKKPLVGILIQGRPHTFNEIEPLFTSILLAGYPGEYGGEVLADILYGARNPSGKLAMTIPKSTGALPVYYNYRDTSFQEVYADEGHPVAYPFGFGLSFTRFSISNVAIVRAGHFLTVRGRMMNIGQYFGSETIQIYIRKSSGNLVHRVKELIAFKKIALESGESYDFEILLNPDEWYFYSEKNEFEPYHGKVKIIVEASDFSFEKRLEV